MLPDRFPLKDGTKRFDSLLSGLRPHQLLSIDLTQAKLSQANAESVLLLESSTGGSLDRLHSLCIDCASLSDEDRTYAFSDSLSSLKLLGARGKSERVQRFLSKLNRLRNLEVDFAEGSLRKIIPTLAPHLRSLTYTVRLFVDRVWNLDTYSPAQFYLLELSVIRVAGIRGLCGKTEPLDSLSIFELRRSVDAPSPSPVDGN